MNKKKSLMTWFGGALLVAATATLGSQPVTASDFADEPELVVDPAADIADFYAWHTDNGTVVAILTFAGGLPVGADSNFDDEVLYTIHIDNTAAAGVEWDCATAETPNCNDNESDLQIHVRFGQNGAGEWGYQIENIPGAEEAVYVAAVDEAVDGGGNVRAIAGTFDDPNLFLHDGFKTTLTLLQDAGLDNGQDPAPTDIGMDRDNEMAHSFTGKNTHAIVVEFDAATALDSNADNLLQLWATTGRVP